MKRSERSITLRKFLPLVCICVLAGCATQAAKQVHSTDDGRALLITGGWSMSGFTIIVNGEKVINNVRVYDQEDLEGVYEGKKVKAQCKIHTKAFGSEQECDVYVGGVYAANLYFR